MPFSRYEIRNEFSLADPELYKTADKDDPEALLEGVAMAGLVGVLRQLGDLAEFAAEIFHGLHEEVMVTAARGHGLLVRVQQVEADFPAIERAFLSQTGHSAFFSSSGISWHPNLQVEQNLITKGDLPRFVMDSYEECRGPPRLFLLDKFDVAGAGACLKRYTDPSFYKTEASSFEMMSAEAQRDKKIRKKKKKVSRMKNGETAEAFQPSHVKLHQLLLEERVQTGANEPARRVKLKKRDIKFPFDTETGKGYMEMLLESPPEDKLVHEVPTVSSPLRLPANSSGERELETLEDRMANSPLGSPRHNGSPYESPMVDKPVSREHIDNVLETSSIESQADGMEEKHISVNGEHKSDGVEDGYESNDVASETEDFMDALATMESEVETDVEVRANSQPSIKHETYSDTNVEQLQSQFSDSQSASDDESSSLKNKIASFSLSDTTSTSADNMSPRGINSPHAFASKEIPFRPRGAAHQASDNRTEVSDNAALPVHQRVISQESTSRESGLSGMSSSNCLDVNIPAVDNDDHGSNISLATSRVEEQPLGLSVGESDICDADVKPGEASFSRDIQAAEEIYSPDTCSLPKRTDDLFESKPDPAEAGVSYSSEDEAELKDRDGDNDLPALEDENEFKDRESESARSESKDLTPVSVLDDLDTNENKDLSTTESVSCVVEKDDTAEESYENGLIINESVVAQSSSDVVKKDSTERSVISAEPDSVSSAFFDHLNIDDLDGPSTEKESIEFDDKKEQSDKSVITQELDSTPSAAYDHLQDLHSDPTSSLATCDDLNENGLHVDNSQDVDFPPGNHVPTDKSDGQFRDSAPDSPVSAVAQESESLKFVNQDVESISLNQVDHIDELEDESTISSHSVPVEKMADQPSFNMGTVDSQDHLDQETDVETHSESYPGNHENYILEQSDELQDPVEPSMVDLSQLNSHINLPGLNMLPQLAPVNIEEAPPLPPLPPMQWRTGKLQDFSMISIPDDGQHRNNDFPSLSPQIENHPSLDQNDNETNEKFEHVYEGVESSSQELPTEPSTNTEEVNAVKFETSEKFEHVYEDMESSSQDLPTEPSTNTEEVDAVKFETSEKSEHVYEDMESSSQELPTEPSTNTEEMDAVKLAERTVPPPPSDRELPKYIFPSEREIIRPSSTSSLPPVDEGMPNGIRPMKIQRPRTPLIDAVAAHDKTKLRKVSERAMPPIPKEEERDTLLEQIRAKSFNLKPAVQTRPSIQGPSTNLRVAAILEKANAIRQAFAGSDDDEDDDDSWSE